MMMMMIILVGGSGTQSNLVSVLRVILLGERTCPYMGVDDD
jgi:hypothetical protein